MSLLDENLTGYKSNSTALLLRNGLVINVATFPVSIQLPSSLSLIRFRMFGASKRTHNPTRTSAKEGPDSYSRSYKLRKRERRSIDPDGLVWKLDLYTKTANSMEQAKKVSPQAAAAAVVSRSPTNHIAGWMSAAVANRGT